MTANSPFGVPVAARQRPRWLVPAVVGGVLLVLVLIAVGQYNGLVSSQNQVDKAASDVEVVQQRKFDLVPQLIDAVDRATNQEQAVFAQVNGALAAYRSATSASGKVAAANQVESGLRTVVGLVQTQPELRSIGLIGDYLVQIEGTENRITQARRLYNEEATAYNSKRRRFPTLLYAGAFGFDSRPLFSQTSTGPLPRLTGGPAPVSS